MRYKQYIPYNMVVEYKKEKRTGTKEYIRRLQERLQKE